MHKNKIWLISALIFLAGCQSSRFMQDDMYFTQIDAIREVREYENAVAEAKAKAAQKEEVLSDDSEQHITPDENYYDYSYTSRLRRFNSDDNTWGYYDPYYTNYYWYNNSNPGYFGNSVYSTYTWWGPHFSGNYHQRYWESNPVTTTNNAWANPWRSAHHPYQTPYNRYAYNGWNSGKLNNGNLWNTGIGYTSMYYNSFDNNCYGTYNKTRHNFSALMQKNGIKRNVFQRPEINYTAIRENKRALEAKTNTDSVSIETTGVSADQENHSASSNTEDANTSIRSTNTSNSTSIKNTSTINNTTTKRWDNHNGDINITPNIKKTEKNTSRSGTYSEGSRNNNYVYSGSAIPKKGSTNKEGKNKGKDSKK